MSPDPPGRELLGVIAWVSCQIPRSCVAGSLKGVRAAADCQRGSKRGLGTPFGGRPGRIRARLDPTGPRHRPRPDRLRASFPGERPISRNTVAIAESGDRPVESHVTGHDNHRDAISCFDRKDCVDSSRRRHGSVTDVTVDRDAVTCVTARCYNAPSRSSRFFTTITITCVCRHDTYSFLFYLSCQLKKPVTSVTALRKSSGGNNLRRHGNIQKP
jgi:hypothetical protein